MHTTEINHALVETIRPPMYKAMKYWGKKPHNIWAEYIETYCPVGGYVLDPFVGSGVSAFEAVRIGRKAIAFDLNPISAFTIEALSSEFDRKSFLEAYERISSNIESDDVYMSNYRRRLKGQTGTVYNYRWFEGKLTKLAIQLADGSRLLINATLSDRAKAEEMHKLKIPYWYPKELFPDTPSITHKFIRDLGGNTFGDLWTIRNLFLLSKLFNLIEKEPAKNVRIQLLFAFVQTLHLTSRMVYPRSPASNRDFSGSWGRADYMIRRKSMEQNPLVVFRRSCIEKQGVLKAMIDVKKRFPDGLKIIDITQTKKIRPSYDINYGIIDISDLSDYIEEKSIDFVITDPPYAGLVSYLPLSLIWLVWLKRIDSRYSPDLNAEITISDERERNAYRRRLQNSFEQIHRVLIDEGKLVVTFHHKEIREWNDFIKAVRLSGFTFDKVTHQYNKRSGESNVSMPYGTSASDFYVRCVKKRSIDFSSDSSGLDHFIVQKTIEIIAGRNEPTPFNFIFDGLVPELLQAGYSQPDDSNMKVEQILRKNCGPNRIFKKIENTETKAGDFWWFNKPEQYISHPDRPLKNRVEGTIISLLRRKISVKFDDVIAELFRTYTNGLTPDIRAVKSILEKFAYRSKGYWKIKQEVLMESAMHANIISKLAKIGVRTGAAVHIGKREQGDFCSDGSILKDRATLSSLYLLENGYDKVQVERIEMIDVIWIRSEQCKVESAFEVEHTSDFMTALNRGSNLYKDTPKFIVIPNKREPELKSVCDPLFIDTFYLYNWRYLTYRELNRLCRFSRPSIDELKSISLEL